MPVDPSAAARLLSDAADSAANELTTQCDTIEFGKVDLDYADVVLGLLARQYQLWVAIVLSPAAWTTASSPLLLRGLVDALITIRWLELNPAFAKQFKAYSAGRFKLLAKHWEALGGVDAASLEAQYAEQILELVNSEQWDATLPVDLGDWSGKSIRSMAMEVDLKDIYDIAYSPLSADAHAEWMTLRSYLKKCAEPLHEAHYLPIFERPTRKADRAPGATLFFIMSVESALRSLGRAFDAGFWQAIRATVDEAMQAQRA